MTTNEKPESRDLVSALLDAHSRCRTILDAALGLLNGGTAVECTTEIAKDVHHSLTVTTPSHELDEEQLIFPALRAYGPKDEFELALTHTVDQHVAFEGIRDEASILWQHVIDAPDSLAAVRTKLLPLMEGLARTLGRHMARQEREIFPLVQKHVPADVQARILAVLSRRDADDA